MLSAKVNKETESSGSWSLVALAELENRVLIRNKGTVIWRDFMQLNPTKIRMHEPSGFLTMTVYLDQAKA